MFKESSSFPWTAVLAIIGVLFVSVALFVSRDSKLEVTVETAESSTVEKKTDVVDSESKSDDSELQQDEAAKVEPTVAEQVPAEVVSVE